MTDRLKNNAGAEIVANFNSEISNIIRLRKVMKDNETRVLEVENGKYYVVKKIDNIGPRMIMGITHDSSWVPSPYHDPISNSVTEHQTVTFDEEGKPRNIYHLGEVQLEQQRRTQSAWDGTELNVQEALKDPFMKLGAMKSILRAPLEVIVKE